MTKPQIESEPKPPFRKQKLGKPGIEAELSPRPRYKAPRYKPAGKLESKIALITGGDLTDPEFCRNAVEKTVYELGQLDILVHNAAHQNRKEKPEDVDDEEWDRTFKTNVYAYFRLVKAALPHLKRGSSIIATGSITGIQGSSELPDYSATKGAIHTLTKTLAQNLVKRGIRVNCVAPGPVWTPLNAADEGQEPKDVAEFGSETPLERPAQPEEIAPAYVFLASDADSSFITGVVLPALGGETV